jgi:hypothetical protein
MGDAAWPAHLQRHHLSQLVICAIRIGAQASARPSRYSKSAGRGAFTIHGGPRALYQARPARSGRSRIIDTGDMLHDAVAGLVPHIDSKAK